MSIFDDATDEIAARIEAQRAPPDTDSVMAAGSADISGRASEVSIGGELVPVEEPDTQQSGDETWLTGASQYGRPRGREAIEARQIVQTSAMQAIANGITDQLVGGELASEASGDDLSSAALELWALLQDVLQGPHLMDDDLDDLIAAAVEDMLGPANAYWQLLPAADGSLPVVSLVPLDPLTIRHNVNKHGYPKDPPYWQASGAFTADGIGTIGNIDPTPLQADQLAVMRYPRGRRSHRYYPYSPAMQVREWLEILSNSTTHHNRFYNDNEIPPGFVQVMNANQNSIEGIKNKIEAASGDPRSIEVIGGEGAAQWIEMGGTAVNLDIIAEQQWFFQMCLGALGLGQHELGFTEDANYSNGEIEAKRIYKRIAGPFAKQFERAFTHVADQFDVYRRLDRPFDITLRFTDPREERAREERLRAMYNDGGLTLREYIRRRGDDDLADNELEVEIGGETIAYGDLPKHVLEHKLREARSGSTPEDDAEDMAEDIPDEENE